MSVPTSHRTYKIAHPLTSDFTNLELSQVDTPTPKGTQVLIRVRAISLNARDVQIASGTYPAPIQVEAGIVPGSDAAGDVIAVGQDVDRVKVGDRVSPMFSQSFISGLYDPNYQKSGLGGGLDGVMQEYFMCDQAGVVHIPDWMSYLEASTLPIAALTAWHALYSIPGCILTPGQTVLVLGTGGVSVAAAQMAAAGGCQVIATSSSDTKLDRLAELVKPYGAELGRVNYAQHREWQDQVRALTPGRRGVDHVIEVGGKGTLHRSIRSCAPGGHVWVIGYMSDYAKSSDSATQTGGDDSSSSSIEYAKEILYSNASVHGIVCGSRDMMEAMIRAYDARRIKPQYDRVFEFERVPEAYRYLQSGQHFGKVCIELA